MPPLAAPVGVFFMHCPDCGVVLDVVQPYWWAMYHAGRCQFPVVITCEEGGERHHVQLLEPEPRREWGGGGYAPPLSRDPVRRTGALKSPRGDKT